MYKLNSSTIYQLFCYIMIIDYDMLNESTYSHYTFVLFRNRVCDSTGCDIVSH